MGWGGRERVGEGRGDFFFQCNKRWKLEDLKQLQQVGWDIRSTGKHHPIWHCKFAVFWWKWEAWSIILASNQNLDAFWEFTWNGWPNWIHSCVYLDYNGCHWLFHCLPCVLHSPHPPPIFIPISSNKLHLYYPSPQFPYEHDIYSTQCILITKFCEIFVSMRFAYTTIILQRIQVYAKCIGLVCNLCHTCHKELFPICSIIWDVYRTAV